MRTHGCRPEEVRERCFVSATRVSSMVDLKPRSGMAKVMGVNSRGLAGRRCTKGLVPVAVAVAIAEQSVEMRMEKIKVKRGRDGAEVGRYMVCGCDCL